MDDLLQEFIAETRETLHAIAGEIVAWETDPSDRARLDAIFRFVHTVKGSCGFLDLPRLARLSHAAEDVLAAVRCGERTPDRQLVNAVLAIIDRIGELVVAIEAGVALDDSSEDLLLAALDGAPAAPETPEAQAPVEPAVIAPRAPTRSVRLSVDLLDRMMSGVSDMVLARNELARRVRDAGAAGGATGLETTLDRLSLTVAELRDTVSRTRMQTIDALFSPLPRVVRDTAATLGKQVSLTIHGGDVELDREMIEMLRDPLVHMVRNALDHGIETPAERRAAGKREAGRLSVGARQSGNRIIVEIADDGRGIDVDRLVNKAIAADPARAQAIAALSPRARLDLIFEPGLSSRDEATALSGRGVGMDVVRSNVEQIGGTLVLANAPGHGLTVSVEVPLTLAILATVVVEAAGETFALPRQAIDEIVAVDAEVVRIDRIGDALLARVRDRRLPLVSLARAIGIDRDDAGIADGAMLLIVDVPGGAYALAVDAVTDTEELVVKPAAPPVMACGLYAGQTLPDSGRPLLLLDCAGLGARAGLSFARRDAGEDEAAAEAVPERPRVLLFDDLDGRRRAIPLAAVDRIETVPGAAIHRSGGRWWATIDTAMVPLCFAVAPTPGPAPAWLLRLHDDRGEAAYMIAEALDIVALPGEIAPAASEGPIAGIALIEDEPIELLDPFWLLDHADCASAPDLPLCLLAGAEAAWMEAMLRPLVTAAGYRVATALAPGETAQVTLMMNDDAMKPAAGGEVLRLARDARNGISRGERTALRTALAARIAR